MKVLPAIPTRGMSREESKAIGQRVHDMIAAEKRETRG